MESGGLVPDKLMIDLVMEDSGPYLEQGKCLLLDGYPRSLGQAIALEEVEKVDLLINLDVPTATLMERIADR